MRKVIITGSSGQDGILLTKKHLSLGDLVFGISRSRPSSEVAKYENFHPVVDPGLLFDKHRLYDLISTLKPSHIYHLASIHGPSGTMGNPNHNEQIKSVGLTSTQNIADAILKKNIETGFTVALSSRMYSENLSSAIDETTPLTPNDFYGHTKMQMREFINLMRAQNGLNAGSAILFNHDSIYKTRGYLSWDIASGLLNIMNGKRSSLRLFNPQLEGDFSHANDIVNGLYLQSGEKNITDYVFGSGAKKSIAEIIDITANNLGIKKICIETESKELKLLPYSNTQKAINSLGWETKQTFESAIQEMVEKLLTEHCE